MNKTESVIGLGTAAIGRPSYINIRKKVDVPFHLPSFKENGIELLEFAYHKGIRYFDTAPGYGIAEQMLTDWVSQKNDPTIEIATKWGYTYVANFDANAEQHEVKEHSINKLNEQWEKSKHLLPYLTTYQIHSATLETGVLENEFILERLAELKDQFGLHIGISTTGEQQEIVIRKALDIKRRGQYLFDVFQVTYNIFDQNLMSILNHKALDGKRIIIKEAMANGRIFPNKSFPQYAEAYASLLELSNKYNVGIDAIAMAFCRQSVPAYTILSGASIESHLTSNLKTEAILLQEKDLNLLKSLSVPVQDYWAERKQLEWN